MFKFVLTLLVIHSLVLELFAQTKQEVYDRINAERAKIGMPAVPVDKRLERSAQSWAVFMPYNWGNGKHNVNFTKWWRFNRPGSECITVGDDPVTNWMGSRKGHRQAIMGRGVVAMGLGKWRGKWVWRSFTGSNVYGKDSFKVRADSLQIKKYDSLSNLEPDN